MHVCKRTIQKYMRQVRTPQPRGQKWATFLRNHAAQIWACDFLQVTDLFFRPLFAFVIIELSSSRVIHAGVTRSPTDPWWRVPLREATPFGQAPKYLIRDNDNKFGPCFARVAATSAIEILKTPYHAKRPNAVCERFLRSVRQECLDHLLIFHEKQLQRVRNRVCGILQSSTTASRYSAANSRIVWITWFLSVQGNQGNCSSDLGWAAP
jgi:putative transposase